MDRPDDRMPPAPAPPTPAGWPAAPPTPAGYPAVPAPRTPAAPPGYVRPAAAQGYQPVTAQPLAPPHPASTPGPAQTFGPPDPATAPGPARPGVAPAPGSAPPPGFVTPPGSVPPPGYIPALGGTLPPGYPRAPGFGVTATPRRRALAPVLAILMALVVLAGAATVLVITAPRVLAGGGSGSAGATGPKLSGLLGEQMAGFNRDDETRYLATVAPDASDARAAFQRFFRNLHAIGVTTIQVTSPEEHSPVGGKTVAHLEFAYCATGEGCVETITMQLRVTVAAHGPNVLIEDYLQPEVLQRDASPLPWAWSDLTVVTGRHVILAASDDEKAQLATVLPVAEAAAANAGKYALWGHPDRYLIYVASSQDAEFWYGGALDGSVGEAIPLTDDDIEVMVILPDAASPRGPGLDAVIAHELGHVVTLYQWGPVSRDSFTEGIADYIALTAHPAGAANELDLAATYLRSGTWSGRCQLTDEVLSHDPLTANAGYAIGYLCLKRMAERFGVRNMLSFWGAVKRTHRDVDEASRDWFKLPWANVEADCVAYVHQALDA